MLQDHEAIPLSVMAPRQSYDELDDDLVVASATHDSQAPLIASSYNKQLPSSRFSSFKRIFQRPVAHPSLDTRPDRIVNPSLAFSKNYSFPSNSISNAKYNAVTFLPVILYEQFKFFFNLYFLLVAFSQAIPALRIGYLSSYIVPLAFVLTVTMSKEAWDDILRRRRDREANTELYQVLTPGGGQIHTKAQDLKVGNLVKLHKDQRIPADMILVQSSETTGESFIRTDQLDGETDWKLR